MRYVGVDLHKHTLVVCVMEIRDGERAVVARGRWACREAATVGAFFAEQQPLLVIVLDEVASVQISANRGELVGTNTGTSAKSS